MKRFITLIAVAAVLTLVAGCATMSTTSSTAASVTSAQDAATKTVVSIGQTMYAAPTITRALYDAGKITKEQYNSVVPIYNQALASYQLLNSALQTAISAGIDPATATKYTTAMTTFLTDKATLENLITALGGTK